MSNIRENDSILDCNNSKLNNSSIEIHKDTSKTSNNLSQFSNNTTLKLHTTKETNIVSSGYKEICNKNNFDRRSQELRHYHDHSNDTSTIEDEEQAGDRNTSRTASRGVSLTQLGPRSSSLGVDSRRRTMVATGRISLLPRQSVSAQNTAQTRRKRKQQNSYWLTPPPGRQFPRIRCKDVVESTLSNFFCERIYSRQLTSEVKLFCNSVISLLCRHPAMEVHRLVVHVTLVQLGDQGIFIADRATGHKDIDDRYSTVRKFKTYAVVVSVFSVFKE